MRALDAIGLVAWILVCYVVAAIGAQFEPGVWYEAIAKPAWTPPDRLFGPVWGVLYVMMAVAAWVVWRRGGFISHPLPLSLFMVQLVLNAAWSWLFFGLNRPGVALLGLCLLLGAVAATLLLFWRVQRVAGALLAPYLLWISFATALNFEIWRLNA